ncbi:MAG: nuclear transport factor 2 family protein [Terriglobales bacterium]|jgi:putative lumazine-binding protein
MKYRVLGLGLLTLLLLNLPAVSQQKASDDAAVRATVTDYIEGYFTGDAARMQKSLHPHYLKHVIHGDIPMRKKNASQMMRDVRSEGVPDLPQAARTEQISVLDVSGDMASVKLVTPRWTDYVTLSRLDGEWKILSVVQRIDD